MWNSPKIKEYKIGQKIKLEILSNMTNTTAPFWNFAMRIDRSGIMQGTRLSFR